VQLILLFCDAEGCLGQRGRLLGVLVWSLRHII
jgi:hypothetical protein